MLTIPTTLNRLPWEELDSRGYVVIREFERDSNLLASIADTWRQGYYPQPLSGGAATEVIDKPVTREFKKKLVQLAEVIARSSSRA